MIFPRPTTPPPETGEFAPDSPPISAQWFIGWLGAWFVLAGMAEIRTTADVAKALSATVALSVSMLLLPDTLKRLNTILGR